MSFTRAGFHLYNHGYSHITRHLNQSELKLLKKVFCDCDNDQKGFLSREDLKIAIVMLFGYKPSKYEAFQILDNYGTTTEMGEKVLNESQFIKALAQYIIKRDEEEEIRHTFLAFDTKCNGFLTFEDLCKVVSLVAPHLSHHIIETAFRELDRDGDKRISYKDFEFMMKYGKDM